MTELLTTSQVQDMLKVDRTTIYRMVEGGRLPAIRVGKQWRFARPDIEGWVQAQSLSAMTAPASAGAQHTPDGEATPQTLQVLLPIDCVQMIQDAFAETLGVMMVTADMNGLPVTQVSNPCGLFTVLAQDPHAVAHCVRTWQGLAAAPAIEPRLTPSEVGLLCARGLIRAGSELKGMVVMGGIAPAAWPPGDALVDGLAHTFHVGRAGIDAHVDEVYHLDAAGQDKALRTVQRVADIFSHIVRDRLALTRQAHSAQRKPATAPSRDAQAAQAAQGA